MNERELLKDLGLTKYQIDAYLALIEEGSMTAKELADASGVPQPKIYSTLESLETLNLVEVLPDFPRKYKAISPTVAIPKLIEEKKQHLVKVEKEAESLVKELEKEYKKKQPKPNEYVWVVQRGRREFIERLVEFINESKEEVLLFTLHFSMYPGFRKALSNAIKRGVRVKVIGHVTPETKEAFRIYKKIGCDIRDLKHNYPRFAVFDGKKTAIRIGDFYINIVVADKPFSQIFKQFFNESWKKAKKPVLR